MRGRETENPGGGAEEYRFKSGTLAVLEGRPMTTWAMTRRLPQLVRRASGSVGTWTGGQSCQHFQQALAQP